MSAPGTPLEQRLLAALRDITRAARSAEAVMRAGNCPKCGAEPVAGDDFDEEFALSMCPTEMWCDFDYQVTLAEEALSGLELDVADPPRAMLEAGQVAIDRQLSLGSIRGRRL